MPDCVMTDADLVIMINMLTVLVEIMMNLMHNYK